MNENIFKDIGLNIVFHRKLCGVNQVECAKRANISVAKLSKIERGISVEDVPLATYLRIAEALQVELYDLLKKTTVEIKVVRVKKE